MFNIRSKIALTTAILAILVAGSIISALYLFVRTEARQSFRQRLTDNAALASLLIDADQHASIRDPQAQESEEYIVVRQTLDAILESNPNLVSAFTIRNIDNQFRIVVSSTAGVGEPADMSKVGEDARQAQISYAANPRDPWVDEEFSVVEGDTYLSSYTPINTSTGRIDGFLGIVMQANELSAYDDLFFQIALSIFIASLPLAFLVGWLLGNNLSGAINTIIQEVERLSADNLDRRIQIERNDEIGTLALVINNLAGRVRHRLLDLEEQVTSHMDVMGQRSSYLEATSQLSQSIATILDIDELITQTVDQIQQRFDLYYVGLFMVDAGREWAVLKAGTGAAGETMVGRGHRIKIGSGMIGWSIANAQPRIAQAAGRDAVRLATSELPETRSEAALPLRSRGQVLGALTIQSSIPEAFDESAITALQIMADQVAIALDNAQLYTESQAALEAERRASRLVGQADWERFTRTRAEWGYRFADEELMPADGEWTPEMEQASQTRKAVLGDNGDLAIPITVRDLVVGVLRFRRRNSGRNGPSPGEANGSRSWTPDEISTLETILTQVGQAIESAQLYRETQRRAAQEQLAGEVTTQMRASLDIDTVIRTAIREISEKLDITQVEVHLGEASSDE